jgi:hypothetical protein
MKYAGPAACAGIFAVAEKKRFYFSLIMVKMPLPIPFASVNQQMVQA